jgi:oligopeptide transport system permease protein
MLAINQPPSSHLWFGGDELGRDLFVRTCWGGRISLSMGILAAIIDLTIGVFWGTLSALSYKSIDNLMMRVCDILQGIPHLLVVIMITVILSPGISSILIALTITGWISMARIIRSKILQIQHYDFVLAAKVMGASFWRIFFHHLLRNAFPTICATLMMTIPQAIFAEAFLSFMGLGIQAPAASWGVMISESIHAIEYFPFRLFFPSLFLITTIFSFHFLSEGINDYYDPKYKESL